MVQNNISPNHLKIATIQATLATAVSDVNTALTRTVTVAKAALVENAEVLELNITAYNALGLADQDEVTQAQ